MAALRKSPPHRMTVAEFLEWDSGDASGARWQLRDGEPERVAPASDAHGTIQNELGFLITRHCRDSTLKCRVVSNGGVVPPVRADHNALIPDLVVTCSPVSLTGQMVPSPLALIEILSPSNEARTWANIWPYTAIPSVAEILVVSSTSMSARIFRRRLDGGWPDRPDQIGPDGELTIAAIGFAVKLRDVYEGAGLGAAGEN